MKQCIRDCVPAYGRMQAATPLLTKPQCFLLHNYYNLNKYVQTVTDSCSVKSLHTADLPMITLKGNRQPRMPHLVSKRFFGTVIMRLGAICRYHTHR